MNKHIKYLIENKLKFDITGYTDDEDNIITHEEASSMLYTVKPKTREELDEILVKRLMENVEEPYLLDIDTSLIDDMSFLFYEDINNDDFRYFYNYGNIDTKDIRKLDLSTWNTSNVKDMCYMFAGCTGLTELDISGFNT